MKQLILVFSMAFLCISAFAQDNTASKVKAPITLANSTDKQAPEGKKSDVQAKPELEKKTATVAKRTKQTLRAGDVKDKTTPPSSGAVSGQKKAKQSMIGYIPTPPAVPVGTGSSASTPVKPAPPKGSISAGSSAPTTRSNLRAKTPVKVPSPTKPVEPKGNL